MSENCDHTDIRIDCESWRGLDCEALAAECFNAVDAMHEGMKSPVCVLFTDDASIAGLNEQFRGKPKPTNVLSFPPGEPLLPEHDYLGDIAIAFETCDAQANEKGVSLRDHTAHLLVHGLLHLVGYDHQDDEEAAEMEGLETTILERLGVSDPYGDGE